VTYQSNDPIGFYTRLVDHPTPRIFVEHVRLSRADFDEPLLRIQDRIEEPRNIYGKFTAAENRLRRRRRTKQSTADRLVVFMHWLGTADTQIDLAWSSQNDNSTIHQNQYHILEAILEGLDSELVATHSRSGVRLNCSTSSIATTSDSIRSCGSSWSIAKV
jgi:hypothetical protein